MRYIKASVLLCILLCAAATYGQKRSVYKTYNNPRFEFSVLYPANILTMQPPPENGDGRIFRSADGETEMRAYGGYNALFKTLAEVYQEECSAKGREITYKKITKTWFVVSGYEGEKVFYHKQVLKNETFLYRKQIQQNEIFLTLTIEYPKSRRKVFDPITAKIAKSFK